MQLWKKLIVILAEDSRPHLSMQCFGGCTSGEVCVPCIYTEGVPLVEFRVYVPCIYTQDVPLVEFMYLVFTQSVYLRWSLELMYLVFTRMPGESDRSGLGSLL